MAISFREYPGPGGGVGVAINTSDAPDTGGTTTINRNFALDDLPVGTVIRFSKRDTTLIRFGAGDSVWPVLDVFDGSYPCINGIAEFEIEAIQGQNYRVRRLDT